MFQKYGVTGLMSGSSLDGVDLAYCEFFRERSGWKFRIVVAETLPYSSHMREKLDMACKWEFNEIELLDLELGELYATLINEFHDRHNLVPHLISSHGHTILHEPEKGITYQAGHGGIIADKTRIQVVNDFRREDVAQGGQGAPLVPVGDHLLFCDYSACLNLGGFANISYEDRDNRRIAYDICPANMALNWLAGLQKKDFDANGEMARLGRINESLLDILNGNEYYKAGPPKSLGREWFLGNFLPLIKGSELDEHDRMATLAEHLAIQIASAIGAARAGNILVTGGGALNQFLMERLEYYTGNRIHIPDTLLIQFKEAMVFAFLGLLRIQGEINCFASVTGGNDDLSTGTIHNPIK